MQKLFHILRRNRFFRFCVVSFICLLCLSSGLFQPVVTAYATGVEAFVFGDAFIAVIGAMLGVTGTTFADRDSLTRGVGTFYSDIKDTAPDLRTYIDDNFDKTATTYDTSAVTFPTVLFSQFVGRASSVFASNKKEALDNSNIVSKSERWRSYVGLSLDSFDSAPDGDLQRRNGIPIPISLNKFAPSSPYSTPFITTISPLPLNHCVGIWDYNFYPHTVFSDSQVFRVKGLLNNTYDYHAYIAQTSSGLSIEITENGILKQSLVIPYSGVATEIGAYTSFHSSGVIIINYFVTFVDLGNRISHIDTYRSDTIETINLNLPASISKDCTIVGLADSSTGVIKLPTVPYIPDASISADGVWDKAMEKEKAKNPDYVGPTFDIPKTPDDVINKKWEDILAGQNDLINSLRDAISSLEDVGGGTTTGDIVIGAVGVPTLADGTKAIDSAGEALAEFMPEFGTILSILDPNAFTIPSSISRSVLWVNKQFMKIYGELIDFKIIVMFPLIIGFAMLLIGMGAHTINRVEIGRRSLGRSGSTALSSSNRKSLPSSHVSLPHNKG